MSSCKEKMDLAGKDSTNGDPQKRNDEPINYQPPNMSSDWQVNGNPLTNTSIGMIPSMVEPSASSSATMVDSFCPPMWDQSLSGQSLSYSNTNVQNAFLPAVSGMLPHFPADSAFIERAARFSCFGGGGNFGETMNPFSSPADCLNPYARGLGPVQEVFGGNVSKLQVLMQMQRHEMDVSKEASRPVKMGPEGSPFKNDEAKQASGNESDEAGFSGGCGGAIGESFGKGVGPKKRKRGEQDNEHDGRNEASQRSSETAKDDEGIKQKGDQNPSSISKSCGKNGKQVPQGSDPPKEEYIHVRARRGQATNSHSLAERVRREKISERMKFLQDLVPGCSKVTGKAVMLDEIINYVQSLQRQVEFLSMKLATVNPRLDFNIEGFLAKDILQPRAGMSSPLAFLPNMNIPFPQLHPSPPGLIQACLSGNSSETLQRSTNPQSTAVCGGFKEPTFQVPGVWDDELHNVVHMGFNPSAPLDGQDLSGSMPQGHMKAET